MKRLTSILAISVIAVMSAGAARADIASTTYVDKQVAPVSTKANTNANAIETLKSDKENVANKVASGGDMKKKLKEADADTKYPTLKAALEIAQIAAGAATEDLGDLTARVGTAETNITSLQNGKQDKLVSSGANANISGSNGVTVTVGTDGKVAVSGNQNAIDTAISNMVSKTSAAATYATKTELGNKQDKLDTTQLAAVNSGATKAKIDAIATNTTAAANAKSAADAAQDTANTAKKTAEAAIAAPAAPAAGTETSNDGLYTLTMKVDGSTRTYAWEKIGR